MRIALVTPYSWTYEGGVNRHTQALAEQLISRGNEVSVLAPWDPPDRLSTTLHRGAAARRRSAPDYLVPLGRTVGFHANGSVSNLAVFPDNVTALRRALDAEDWDVVHVQEPPAPTLSWAACSYGAAPVVGTFHAYAPKWGPNQIANALGARRKFNQLSARIAVSEAAAWTGKRWFGGNYEVIPNGVEVDAAQERAARVEGAPLELLFIGRPEERKGLPVLLRAFEALHEHARSRLVLVGVGHDDISPHIADPAALNSIEALGSVSREQLWERLAQADILCAPSLSGESFGMVLTEAFAAGTPVVASAIAGYSDVVTDGHDGILVPAGDPQRLAEELQRLHASPALVSELAAAAKQSAERYAWPRVAERIEAVYERAIDAPAPVSAPERLARRAGLAPSDGEPYVPPQRLPSLEPAAAGGSRRRAIARRLGLGLSVMIAALLTYLAAQRIGVDKVVESAVSSDLAWVIAATGLMMASMFFRGEAWFQAARAALPTVRVRRRDVTSATMVGVLMSATLPARVGEPARAMVMARRIGRVRESFPVLLGTLVSQTILNVLALVLLGIIIIVAGTDFFARSSENLFLFSLAPAALLLAVVVAPALVRRNGSGRIARVAAMARDGLVKVRSGLAIFRDPRRGPVAAVSQLTAWAVQVGACYALAIAMGLDAAMGIGGAAAVLFAINVTAVVPATPSNIGIFQLAVISVLTAGYGISAADAFAYGVILQAVEIATAVTLGLPALVREGMSWSDVRLRALSAAPVRLQPLPSRERGEPVSS